MDKETKICLTKACKKSCLRDRIAARDYISAAAYLLDVCMLSLEYIDAAKTPAGLTRCMGGFKL
jgi:hypothetical protein